MSKHTPGPWYVEYAATRVRWPVIVVPDDRYEEGVHEIAQVSDHTEENRRTSLEPIWHPHEEAEEAEANARLIAAAPDLLKACKAAKKALGFASKVFEEDGQHSAADPCDTALEQICAAILIAEKKIRLLDSIPDSIR